MCLMFKLHKCTPYKEKANSTKLLIAYSDEGCDAIYSRTCADPESFVRGSPTLTTSFLVDEGREN